METQQEEYGGEPWLPKLLTGRFREAAAIIRKSREEYVQGMRLSGAEINTGLKDARSDSGALTDKQQSSA